MTSILADSAATAEALAQATGPLFEQIDNARSLYRSDELSSLESDDGPVGFPRMFGVEKQMGLLEWLASIGAWSSSAQCEFMAFQLNAERIAAGSKALSKAELRTLQKNWTVLPSGAVDHPSTLVTATLLHPILRMKALNTLSFQRVWLTSPYGSMLRASQRMLGLSDTVTMDDFTAVYANWQASSGEAEQFWPKQLWPTDNMDDFTSFGEALTGYLHCLLCKAREWPALDNRGRNGILLGCHAAAVLLCSCNYLLPFAALSPELKTALNMSDATPETMCDEQGNPTMLLSGAMRLANIIAGPNASSVVPLIATPLAGELDRLFANPEKARSELRNFRLSQVATACKGAASYLEPAQKSLPELPEDAAVIVKQALADLEEWRQLTGLVSGAELTPEAQDYWQRQFVDMAGKLPKRGVSDLFNLSLRGESGTSLSSLLAEAATAVKNMDAAKLSELAGLMESHKAATISAVSAYIAPVSITDDLRSNVPQVAPVVIVEAGELDASQRRIDELTQELAHTAELLQLHDDQEANLREKLTEASNQLRREQARCESLTAQLSGKQSQQEGPSEALLRALTDELTMADAVSTVAALYPRTAVFTTSAYESAANCSYKYVRKAMSMLLRLCGPYHEALSNGENDDKARVLLGAAYRAQESDSTLSSTKMRAQREFMYNGTKHLFQRHLTLGVSRGDQTCMQVYFEVIDGQMVIAYVGPHLDTSST